MRINSSYLANINDMATTRPCLAQLSRLCLSSGRSTSIHIPSRFLSSTAPRAARGANAPKILSKKEKSIGAKGQNPQKNLKKKKGAEMKKRKPMTDYRQYDMKDMEQFSLCDAMRYEFQASRKLHLLIPYRYIRAFEVGRKPTSVKYELHVKLKSQKNGPVVRNRLRLPHPVKTDIRICVICPPGSKYAESAKAAGAILVGEEDIFEAVKDGRIEFDRCICQTDSLAKMNKAGLGRILGPRGLMPSTKMGTVVQDPSLVLKDLIGGAEYRERMGVVRMAVGQLGFTPEEMQRNIKYFIEAVKKDMGQLSDRISKDLAEVVLSSTNSPGFSLNGNFRDPNSGVTPRDLSTS
jgi:large subunit ribosomal protein L1